MAKKLGKKAVVIGASMAGLLAARVLADQFEQVFLLDRDIFPAPGANRKGVPQGKHAHVLLELGRRTMENLLPGLTDDLAELGAVRIEDASQEVRWYRKGYHQPGISGVPGLGVSRPTLEAAVRRRVLVLPNVSALQDVNVTGLLTTADNRLVTGVRMINRQVGNEEIDLLADLVVDAGGRGSRSPAWLEGLGYKRPDEEEVRVDLGYTSCYFRRLPGHLHGLHGITFLTEPPDKHMGVMLAQERDRWVVTLGGYLGEHTSTDYRAFLKAAQNLPTPQIYNVIRDTEPLGKPIAYSFPANLRRRYDRLERFPQNYLVIGDALCSFNPIYAQGMTVAALEAEALGESLAQKARVNARDFFARSAKIIDASWSAAVGNDLSFSEVEGPRTPMVRFFNWYIDKLHNAAHYDEQVSIAFMKMINMVAAPATILNPRIVWRVIKHTLWPPRRPAGEGKMVLEN